MRTLIAATLVALSLAAPALADKVPAFVVTAPVKDQPAVVLDKTKAYILLRSDAAVSLTLMKEPTAEDQAAWDRLRADALVKARAKYVKKQREYDGIVRANADIPSGSRRTPLPDKPIEPTEGNFKFTPFGVLTAVAIGPTNRFAKGDGASTYLQEVTPGRYRVYGPLMIAAGGAAAGACFCMGSVGFEAKAGEITDLGAILIKVNAPDKRPDGDSSAPMMAPAGFPFFSPPPAGMAVDPRLRTLPIVPAKFHAVGKLPNYYGVTISRIPPIPGVIDYDRDRIIDLRAH